MKTSRNGLDLIKKFESLHDGDLTLVGLQPKMCPAGVWTEGYGHAMRDKKGAILKGAANKNLAYALHTVDDEKEASALLAVDVAAREVIVMQKIHVPINQNQFDAVVSHTYNTGGSQTLFDLINKGANPEFIRSWILDKYITAAGVVQRGLIRRRQAECDLFFTKII